jgi:hypothetical protein
MPYQLQMLFSTELNKRMIVYTKVVEGYVQFLKFALRDWGKLWEISEWPVACLGLKLGTSQTYVKNYPMTPMTDEMLTLLSIAVGW